MNFSSPAHQAAHYLLASKAVNFNLEEPYTWASGWHSPMYCDNRVTLSYPDYRGFFKQQLMDLVAKHFSEAEAVAGVATAGIAQGAMVADALEKPFLYVRPKPKGHGLGNQIEGRLDTTKPMVMVEDLISTGGSVIKAAEALRKVGGHVVGIVSLFTYGFPQAEKNLAAADLKLATITNYSTLIEVAMAQELLPKDQLASLQAWRQSPDTWHQD